MTTSYTASNSLPMSALPTASGILQRFPANATNTGASTYAPDGLIASPIFGLGGQPLQGNEIISGGNVTLVSYIGPLLNSGALCWVLLDATGGSQQVAPATQSQHAVQLGQVQQNFAWNHGFQVIASTQNFAVPASVFFLRYRIWGGGAGSGGVGSTGNGGAGGGGAGGFTEGILAVNPGDIVSCIIGAGGTAGGMGGAGGAGGTRSFTHGITMIPATGGVGGAGNSLAGGDGGTGGSGSGGQNNLSGAQGGAGGPGDAAGGQGGTPAGGGGAGGGGGSGIGGPGQAPGGGGGGSGGTTVGVGAPGGRGQINFEW